MKIEQLSTSFNIAFCSLTLDNVMHLRFNVHSCKWMIIVKLWKGLEDLKIPSHNLVLIKQWLSRADPHSSVIYDTACKLWYSLKACDAIVSICNRKFTFKVTLKDMCIYSPGGGGGTFAPKSRVQYKRHSPMMNVVKSCVWRRGLASAHNHNPGNLTKLLHGLYEITRKNLNQAGNDFQCGNWLYIGHIGCVLRHLHLLPDR